MLIPLINIIFLMLIFYMLAGTIVPSDRVNVEPPVSSSEAAMKIEGITIVVGADGRLAIDGDLVALEELAATLAQRLEQANTAEAAPSPQEATTPTFTETAPPIKLKIDARASAHQLNQTLSALRRAGANRVTLVTAAAPG